MSIYDEVHELRKEIIEMKKTQNSVLDILYSLMKMVDYTKQELLRVNNIEKQDEEERERRELRDYNSELIKVYEHIEALKKLEL